MLMIFAGGAGCAVGVIVKALLLRLFGCIPSSVRLLVLDFNTDPPVMPSELAPQFTGEGASSAAPSETEPALLTSEDMTGLADRMIAEDRFAAWLRFYCAPAILKSLSRVVCGRGDSAARVVGRFNVGWHDVTDGSGAAVVKNVLGGIARVDFLQELPAVCAESAITLGGRFIRRTIGWAVQCRKDMNGIVIQRVRHHVRDRVACPNAPSVVPRVMVSAIVERAGGHRTTDLGVISAAVRDTDRGPCVADAAPGGQADIGHVCHRRRS